MFNIFTATKKDIPAILDLAEKTWWPAYSPILPSGQIQYMLDTIYGPSAIGEAMAEQSQIFLMLEDENGPQAFASYGMRPENHSVFKLHKLYVLPHNQGKGYGKALVDEIKRRLLKSDIHILDLNVNRHNPARSFYEKLGFRILREEDIPIGLYWMNDYVMRLEF